MSTQPPQVSCIDNIRLGTNEEARLTAALIRSYDDVQAGLRALGDECAASEWTVYRWLRGVCSPRGRVITRLQTLAEQRGVTWDEVPEVIAATS